MAPKDNALGGQTPLSVNYHFSRVCNYNCGFCFHTQTNDFKLPLPEATRGLKMLYQAGMRKINFAGGEPFLYPTFLGSLVEYCKKDLKINVSIVSNGSKLTEKWFEKYGALVDILAISCDSFDSETNQKIGRTPKTGPDHENRHIENVYKAADLCQKYGIKFKINTVVNRFNFEEDMSERIAELKPSRWKVFQVLMLESENDGGLSKRDAKEFMISDDEFQYFLKTNESVGGILVPEDNSTMKNSYLILDERMRFLNCENGGKVPSQSLLDVGVAKALEESGFDRQMFFQRGGQYEWSRNDGCSLPADLAW